jgi:hypothetical protein
LGTALGQAGKNLATSPSYAGDTGIRQQIEARSLYLHDYGSPVGMRMAIGQPEKVEAVIIQNAVSH